MTYIGRLLFGSLLFSLAALAYGQGNDRIALVVGNSAYPKAPLLNPRNDAQAMAALLRQAGFTVDQQMDTSQTQLSEAAARFGKAIKDPKVKFGLFYYAGHGLQQDWRNYLVPVTADIRTAEDVKKKTVDVSELLTYMEQAKGRSFLVILDACRDDPFAGSYKTTAKGLSQFDAPVGSLLAFATSPGSVAEDGEGSNGLYTSNLLREFAVRGARLEDAFKRVRLNVRLASKGRQVPWESTSLEEDVYLFPSERKKLSESEQDQLLEREIASWLSVKSSNDYMQLGNFIREYPSGSASELAQARLSRLLEAQATQESQRLSTAAASMAEANREAQARVEAARRQAEQAEAQRLAAEQAERARQQAVALAAARQEAERLAVANLAIQQAEAARQAEQKQKEAQARAAQLEIERLAAARALQEAELARAEAQRLASARAEAERIAAERLQAQQLAALRAQEVQRNQAAATQAQLAEQGQKEAQAKAEADKLAAANAKRESDLARAETQRLTIARLDAERAALEQQKAQTLALAQADEAQRARALADAAAAQSRLADQQRLAQQQAEARQAEQARLGLAKLAQEKDQAAARLATESVAAAQARPITVAQSTGLPVTPYYKGFEEHRRSYQIGDVFGYQVVDRHTKLVTPLTMQVTAVDVNADRVEYNNGEYVSDTMGNILTNLRGGFSTPRQFYPAELYVGKKWQTAFKQSRGGGVTYTFRYDMKVVGRETITVPAGTFDTFKIEARGYNIQLGARLERNIWVSPGVSSDIAQEIVVRLRTGVLEQNDRQELVSLKVSKPQVASR